MESYLNNQIFDELKIEESDDNSLKEEKDYESDFQNESSFIPQNEISEHPLNTSNINTQMNLDFLDFMIKRNNIIREKEIIQKNDKYYVGRKKSRPEINGNNLKKGKSVDIKSYDQDLIYSISKYNKISYKNEEEYIPNFFKEENIFSLGTIINNLNLKESKSGIINNVYSNSKYLSDSLNKKGNKDNINSNKYLVRSKNFIDYCSKDKTLHQNGLNKCSKNSKFFGGLNNDNIYSKISIDENDGNINLNYSGDTNVFPYFSDLGNKNINNSNEYNYIMNMNNN